jgi:hypothetical protein
VYETDIVEAPTRHVHQELPESNRPTLRFGTIGSGLDVARMVWPCSQHVFSSQTTSLIDTLPGRPSTKELGPPERVPKDQLLRTPVDALLVDVESAGHWERWVQAVSRTPKAPKIIAQSLPPEHLSDKSKEAGLHMSGKRMRHLGYGMTYLFLQAHKFGAALHQDRLFVVFYSQQYRTQPPTQPPSDSLPPRSMANLLTPVGIPRHSFAVKPGQALPQPLAIGPCQLWGHLGWRPVYSIEGAMPDDLSAYLQVRGRCRRLQSEELAKAKGSPSEWNGKPAKKVPVKSALLCTSLHLWAVVGDSLATWWNEPGNGTNNRQWTLPTTKRTHIPGQDDFIAWTMPDLAAGGDWHRARQSSLKKAAAQFPNAVQLVAEGEIALDIHRRNYTDAGPQRLQLLWWEFPPEHWEALRLGSSMNFLVDPTGATEPNSVMDAEQLAVAVRFVDELVSLGVLVEATEEL